jgi:hypothetical protein
LTQQDNATSFPVALTVEQEGKLDVLAAKLDALLVELLQKTEPANTQIVSEPDAVSSGNITTQNLVPTGAATTNSAVEVDVSGKGSLTIQVSGTYTGVLSVQGRVNSSAPWVTLSGASFLIRDTAAYSATIASAAQGIWQCDCAGYAALRVTALAAVTGTATVYLRAAKATTLVALDTALPAGSAALGSVTVTSALVAGTNSIGGVTLRPDAGFGAGTLHHRIAGATNVVSVKASAGNINSLSVSNRHASNDLYFKLYNSASAPTLGGGTPVQVWRVRPNTDRDIDLGVFGIRCSTGIAYALTSDLADNGVTNIQANDALVAMSYT